MDPGVLISILDLRAAVANADVDALEQAPFGRGERVPEVAEGDRKISGWMGASVVVLVVHAVGWREDDAVTPVDTLEVLVALVPEQ